MIGVQEILRSKWRKIWTSVDMLLVVFFLLGAFLRAMFTDCPVYSIEAHGGAIYIVWLFFLMVIMNVIAYNHVYLLLALKFFLSAFMGAFLASTAYGMVALGDGLIQGCQLPIGKVDALGLTFLLITGGLTQLFIFFYKRDSNAHLLVAPTLPTLDRTPHETSDAGFNFRT